MMGSTVNLKIKKQSIPTATKIQTFCSPSSIPVSMVRGWLSLFGSGGGFLDKKLIRKKTIRSPIHIFEKYYLISIQINNVNQIMFFKYNNVNQIMLPRYQLF